MTSAQRLSVVTASARNIKSSNAMAVCLFLSSLSHGATPSEKAKDGPERQRAVTQEGQDDQADDPERRIFPAAVFVAE